MCRRYWVPTFLLDSWFPKSSGWSCHRLTTISASDCLQDLNPHRSWCGVALLNFSYESISTYLLSSFFLPPRRSHLIGPPPIFLEHQALPKIEPCMHAVSCIYDWLITKNYSFGQSQNISLVISLFRVLEHVGEQTHWQLGEHVGNVIRTHLEQQNVNTPTLTPPKEKNLGCLGACCLTSLAVIHFFLKKICWPELVAIFGVSKWQGHELWISTVPLLVSKASKHTVLTLGPSLAKGWPFGQPWVLHCVHKAMLCSSHWDFPLLEKEKGSWVCRC